SRRRHTRLQGDWSSDVCSSDLMLVDFLDTLGIAHKEGVVEDLPASMPDEKLHAAVDAVLAKYPAEVVAVYLNAFNEINEVDWPRSEERRVGKTCKCSCYA